MKNLSNIAVGIAGEYFVAGELAIRNFNAAITLRNNESYDILCTSPDGKKQFGVQVKTTRNSRNWLLNKKVETGKENLFFIFVNILGLDQRPEYFVIHSIELAEMISKAHQNWLITPGRGGRPHKDNPNRKFNDKEGDYLERWDLLES